MIRKASGFYTQVRFMNELTDEYMIHSDFPYQIFVNTLIKRFRFILKSSMRTIEL